MLIQNSPSKIALSANQILDIKDAYKKACAKIEASEPVIDIRRDSNPIETIDMTPTSETLNMGSETGNIFDTFNPNPVASNVTAQNQNIAGPVSQVNPAIDIFKTIPNDIFTPNTTASNNQVDFNPSNVESNQTIMTQSEPVINLEPNTPVIEPQPKEANFDAEIVVQLSQKCDLLRELNEEIDVKSKQREIYLEEISELSKKLSQKKENDFVSIQEGQIVTPNNQYDQMVQNTQNISMQQTSQMPQMNQMQQTSQMPQMPQNNSVAPMFGESGAEYTNIFDAPFVNNAGTYQKAA